MVNENTLGPTIKQYLADNGIKQTFLATKLNVPDSKISDILAGVQKINAIDYYLICKALRVEMEFFFKKEAE